MKRSFLRLPLALAPLLLAACSGPPQARESLSEASAPIIGGVFDGDGSAHENVVFLAAMTNKGQFDCTGSLIAPNVVLTARHCVSNLIVDASSCDIDGNSLSGPSVGTDLDPSVITVYLGASPNGGQAPAATATMIFHPPGDNLCNKDIALLVLDTNITSVAPLKLRLNYGPQLGEMTTPVGYGKTTMDDFSAGQRYRRENVAVTGVGRDWNALTGENEFSMGESICQGDSGGPVLAGSSGAVIGVTSRGANCFGNNNIFSRVDLHADIIMMALTAGQAQASLEGNTPPAPPTPLADGQGPCTDGSQCAGQLCLNPGTPTSTCTTVCTPSGCASHQLCLTTTVSIEGNAATLPACVPKPAANDCDACRSLKCKSTYENCAQDKACSAMLLCTEPCTTKSCIDACAAANPSAAPAYQTIADCQCGAKCSARCAVLCSDNPAGAGGTTGGAGAAGASSGGSGGSGGSDQGPGGASAGGASPAAGGSSSTGGGATAGGPGKGGAGGSDAGPGGAGHGGSPSPGTGGSAISGVGGSSVDHPGHAGGSSPLLPPSAAGGASSSSTPALQPTSGGSSGGCSTSGAPGSRSFAGLFAGLGLLAASRRSRRRAAEPNA